MKSIDYYMNLDYSVIVTKVDDAGDIFYSAKIKELPGFEIFGDSFDDIFSELDDAKRSWFEAAISLNRRIDEPDH